MALARSEPSFGLVKVISGTDWPSRNNYDEFHNEYWKTEEDLDGVSTLLAGRGWPCVDPGS